MRLVTQKPTMQQRLITPQGQLTLDGQKLLQEYFEALRAAHADIEDLKARVEALEA